MPVLSGAAYAVAELRSPQPLAGEWPQAPAQSRGSDWFYEVFTPPAITYDPVARSFAVVPSRMLAEPVSARSGLELLTVKREPYRLQLFGYVGEPGDYLAAFVSPLAPETLLVRPGGRIEPLGLILKSFDVRKVAVEGGAGGPAYEIAAFAVLREETTGAEVVLDSRTRKLTDTPLAVFKIPGAAGRSCDLREGESFADDNGSYRIERIQFDPPEVVVIRTSPGLPAPVVRLLRPLDRVIGKESPPKPLAAQAAPALAQNRQESPSP